MKNGYLLDTNIISALVSLRHGRHDEFARKVLSLQHVWLPVIAIAEIEFGMAKADGVDQVQRGNVRRFFEQFPQHLGIGDNTIEPYALLRAQLWKLYATPRKRGHKEKVPEDLFDRVTGKEIGVDERDLLIASVAAEYGLILVTADKNRGMTLIEKAARKLQEEGQSVNLRIDYW